MNFQTDTVAQGVSEFRAPASATNVVPRDGVGILASHTRPNGTRSMSVTFANHLVNCLLVVARRPDNKGSRDVRAVATGYRTKIHEEEVALAHVAMRTARVGQSGSLSRRHDRLEWVRLAS